MSTTHDTYRDAWLCPDCAELKNEKFDPELTDNYDPETEDGFREFSKTPCYLCQSPLHGYRYRFAQWIQSETLPCQTCGTPVPADIHAEELGFCIPCQHEYFADKCDSCGEPTNRDGGEAYCYPCDPTFEGN